MSFLFDGANDFLDGSLVTAIDTPLSIGCWAKYTTHPAAVRAIAGIGANASSNTSSYMLRTNSTVDTFVPISIDDTGSNFSVTCTKAGLGGIWFPFLMIITSDSLRAAWVSDDFSDGTTPNGGCVPVSFLKVAEAFGGANDFAGWVAEFCVWNKALTTPEQDLFLAGNVPSGIAAANLREYVPMDTNTLGNEGLDAGGDLTANGNAVFDADHPTIIYGGAGGGIINRFSGRFG